jgi:hypothetical protein
LSIGKCLKGILNVGSIEMYLHVNLSMRGLLARRFHYFLGLNGRDNIGMGEAHSTNTHTISKFPGPEGHG